MSSPSPAGLRLPAPTESVPGWQVAPWVDAPAYALSWLWVLVPLVLAGPVHPTDYYAIFALVMTVNTLHRHFGVPLIYLDREVYQRHVTRFSVVPALMGIAVVAMPLVSGFKAPKGFFGAEALGAALAGAALVAQVIAQDLSGFTLGRSLRIAAVAPFALALILGLFGMFTAALVPTTAAVAVAFAAVSAALTVAAPSGQRAPVFAGLVGLGTLLSLGGAFAPGLVGRWPGEPAKLSLVTGAAFAVQVFWGLWHVTMQKVGILRMYAAKQTEVPPERRAPIGVDRFLVWGMFPVYIFVMGPSYRAEVLKAAASAKSIAIPLLDFLEAARPFLAAPAIAVAVGSIGWFFGWEWKTTRCRSLPRMGMGVGTVALNVAVLIWPVKGVIAYTFSHGLEYLVFVWAFQRRRYAVPLAHHPPLQRLLAWPVLAYAGFILAVGGFFFWTDFGKHYGLPVIATPIFGVKFGTWVTSWAIWEALFHYYQDGFMWKMRLPSVRASI